MFRFLIDTTNSYLILSAVHDDVVIFTFINKCINKINENILPTINECLKSNKITLESVDEFYVIVGPGSYTGIRIGVASMLAFSIAYGKPLLGISLLDAFVLSLDKSIIRIFYCIRKNYYITKYYNFEKDIYTDYEVVETADLDSSGILIDDNIYNPANTLLNKKLECFKRDYKPMYFSNTFYYKIKNSNI
jgi:tRNA threonylcarbamoyl adenosine modification protein YeaZ